MLFRSGEDKGAVVDLVSNFILVDELNDGACAQLTSCPSGKNGVAACVADEQVAGNAGALELAGNDEVSKSKVNSDAAGSISVSLVEGIDAGLDLHGLLRIGEYVLAQAVQSKRLCIGHVAENNDGAVLHGEEGSESGLISLVAGSQLANVNDGGITEYSVLVEESSAADLNSALESGLDGSSADIENEVLVAESLDLGNGFIKLVEVSAGNTENAAELGSNSAHSLVVGSVCAVEDGLSVLDSGSSSLHGLNISAVENYAAVCSSSLLSESNELVLLLAAVNEDVLAVHTLADTIVINLHALSISAVEDYAAVCSSSLLVLDFIHPSLEPVAFLHDAEWELSDGTKESFTASNERFKRNGYKVAKAEFSWWRPRRYVVMNHARRFGNICQAFGWSAWMAPFKEKQS